MDGELLSSPRDLPAEAALSRLHDVDEAVRASELESNTLGISSDGSSDSAASSEAEDEYIAAEHHSALSELMREEDAQRRAHAAVELRRMHQPPPPPRGTARALASRAVPSRELARERAFCAKALMQPALALGRRSTPATFACSACRAPLLRPCDVKRGEDVELPVAFCDSVETLCAAPASSGVCEVGNSWEADTEPEEEVGDDGFYLEVPLIFAARCRHVACRGCGLVLGVRVLSLRRRHPHELGPALLRLQQRLERSVASTNFGAPLPHSNARLAMEAADGMRERYDETEVGLDYLGVRLLRLLRGAQSGSGGSGCATVAVAAAAAAAREDLDEMALELRCACCMLPLTASDQVLCTSRCWSLYGGTPESSCFVNSLRPGSYELCDARPVQLSQGRFEMADAYCSGCGEKVGYGFVKDLSPSQENFNQVGRFGLVSRCITWGHHPTDSGCFPMHAMDAEDDWGGDIAVGPAVVDSGAAAAAAATPTSIQRAVLPEPPAPPQELEVLATAAAQEQQLDDCTMVDTLLHSE